jgi:hypothetical protein
VYDEIAEVKKKVLNVIGSDVTFDVRTLHVRVCSWGCS